LYIGKSHKNLPGFLASELSYKNLAGFLASKPGRVPSQFRPNGPGYALSFFYLYFFTFRHKLKDNQLGPQSYSLWNNFLHGAFYKN